MKRRSYSLGGTKRNPQPREAESRLPFRSFSSVMPEAHALRRISWQYFITLTFADEDISESRRVKLVFAFIRYLCKISNKTHFSRAAWCYRQERGGKGGREHFHLCVAWLREGQERMAICQLAKQWWRERTRSIADVQVYDDALDGIGYILKRPTLSALRSKLEEEELQPTLSKSIIRRLR